jgi:hypothetical protein
MRLCDFLISAETPNSLNSHSRSFDFTLSSESADTVLMLQLESMRAHVISPILIVKPSIVGWIEAIKAE